MLKLLVTSVGKIFSSALAASLSLSRSRYQDNPPKNALLEFFTHNVSRLVEFKPMSMVFRYFRGSKLTLLVSPLIVKTEKRKEKLFKCHWQKGKGKAKPDEGQRESLAKQPSYVELTPTLHFTSARIALASSREQTKHFVKLATRAHAGLLLTTRKKKKLLTIRLCRFVSRYRKKKIMRCRLVDSIVLEWWRRCGVCGARNIILFCDET